MYQKVTLVAPALTSGSPWTPSPLSVAQALEALSLFICLPSSCSPEAQTLSSVLLHFHIVQSWLTHNIWIPTRSDNFLITEGTVMTCLQSLKNN